MPRQEDFGVHEGRDPVGPWSAWLTTLLLKPLESSLTPLTLHDWPPSTSTRWVSWAFLSLLHPSSQFGYITGTRGVRITEYHNWRKFSDDNPFVEMRKPGPERKGDMPKLTIYHLTPHSQWGLQLCPCPWRVCNPVAKQSVSTYTWKENHKVAPEDIKLYLINDVPKYSRTLSRDMLRMATCWFRTV